MKEIIQTIIEQLEKMGIEPIATGSIMTGTTQKGQLFIYYSNLKKSNNGHLTLKMVPGPDICVISVVSSAMRMKPLKSYRAPENPEKIICEWYKNPGTVFDASTGHVIDLDEIYLGLTPVEKNMTG